MTNYHIVDKESLAKKMGLKFKKDTNMPRYCVKLVRSLSSGFEAVTSFDIHIVAESVYEAQTKAIALAKEQFPGDFIKIRTGGSEGFLGKLLGRFFRN